MTDTKTLAPTTDELRALMPLVRVKDLAVEYNPDDGLVLDRVKCFASSFHRQACMSKTTRAIASDSGSSSE